MNRIFYLATCLFSMLATTGLFADGEEAPAQERGMSQTLIMIVIALVFFYFIMWRPERKRRKALEQRRSSIRKGDRVTAMGIIGTVSKVEDNTVIVKMYDGAKVEFLKGAITDVQPAGSNNDNNSKSNKEEAEESKKVELTSTNSK